MDMTALQAARLRGCDSRTAERIAARAIRDGDTAVRRVARIYVADEAWWERALETATTRGRKPKVK